MERGLKATLEKKVKLITILILGYLSFSACSSNNTEKHPVIANIQLSDGSYVGISVLADSLEVPWDMDYHAGKNSLFFTEIGGRISRLDLNTGEKKELIVIEEVYQHRTLGLLGMTLHPEMDQYPYVYVSYTTKRSDSIYTRLERFSYKGDALTERKLLLEIPGNTGHNGSRLAFSKNGKLLWATGDAHSKTYSQDSTSLNGKILRMNDDGSLPEDNPIKGSYVYAWGFRNMQGLAVSDRGYVYTSEHGDAIEDEINIIEPLRNYGWPEIEGKHDLPQEKSFAAQKNTKEPLRSWTPVIAPAGLAYYNSGTIPEWKNSLLLTTLKSQTLRVLKLDEPGKEIVSEDIFLENIYGRLRAVTVLPNGDVYLATSNKDWNPQLGFPKSGDDKILRLTRVEKAAKEPLRGKRVDSTSPQEKQSGEALYKAYCASCHKADGSGLGEVFPALKGSAMVLGDKPNLIRAYLEGISREGKAELMPAFQFLSDEDGAAILSYIRTSWGNKGTAVQPEEIKKHR